MKTLTANKCKDGYCIEIKRVYSVTHLQDLYEFIKDENMAVTGDDNLHECITAESK